MDVRRIGLVAVALALTLGACRSRSEQEAAQLRSRVQELEAKVATLEADNGRLKEQIRLLTVAADSLSGAMKVQQQLGALPTPAGSATPAAATSPTPVPSASPAASPR